MSVCAKVLGWLLLGLLFPAFPAMAQDGPKPFKPEELDQLVAPIALHPDPLLAQILMASTYPLEIVQAARFVKENPNVKGDQLNEALKQYPWDDSVKSLVYFPQVLTMMNDKIDWLQKLGDAFLGQQQEVMAAVQRLRARAQASGQLKSTPEQTVTVEAAAAPPPAEAAPPPPPTGAPPPPPTQTTVQVPPAQTTVQVAQAPPTVIKIEPANPQVVYVPSYDPTVVYGAFPPAYPPYYPYPPGYFAAGAFTFMAGAAVGAALWGEADWHHGGGDVNINNSRANNFTQNVNNTQTARNRMESRNQVEHRGDGAGNRGDGLGNRGDGLGNRGDGAGGNRGKWQHNPEHRKGVQYRDNATQQRFDKRGPANAQSREAFRGRTQGSDFGRGGQQGGFGQAGARDRQGGFGQQGGIGQAGARDRQGGFGQQAGGGIGDRGGAGGFGDRGAQASPRTGGIGEGRGGQGRQGGAFQGAGGGGRDAQSFSNRGNASRESFNRSSGGGRSGGGARGGGGGGGGGRGGGGRGGGRR